MKIIFTTGTWDLFHIGHLNILKKAKECGDVLIVGVSTNQLIKNYKNTYPILNYTQRKAIIEELKCVDKVVKQNKLVDIKQFKKLKADKFALGDDWKNNYTNKGINWLRDNNKIIWIPYTKGLSTSNIKEKIIKNAIPILQSQFQRKKI